MGNAELAALIPMMERAAKQAAAFEAQATAIAKETASALAAMKALASRPRRRPVGDEWLAIHADDWDQVARSMIDLADPVWVTPKDAAHQLRLEPGGGAIYDRIRRRPIAVKFGGRWYINMVRADTLTGMLPGESK